MISVVVMGYHNEATIVAAVRSLVEQRADEPFEVVVVVSGGDGSAAAVRAAFPDLVVVDEAERLLPGGARNRGVAATRGGIVAFLAADCVATPGWIQARIDAHRARDSAVASAVTTADPQTVCARAHTYDLYCARLPGRPAGWVDGDPAAHGLSFPRAVLDRVGPFPDDVRVAEDTAMVERLHEAGVPIWFAPTIVTAHHAPRTPRALVADRYARGARAARSAGEAPAPWATVLAAAPRPWWRRLRWVLRTGWRHTRTERTRFLGALPWLVVGHTAGEVGRARGRLAGPSRPGGLRSGPTAGDGKAQDGEPDLASGP